MLEGGTYLSVQELDGAEDRFHTLGDRSLTAGTCAFVLLAASRISWTAGRDSI
jgi:hypothetical protein